MKKKTNKHGFTIVELVIVIAIVAILAAVLIPTFVNLTKNANHSVDLQIITNINKQLAIAEATDGKNETMHEAVLDARAAGFDLTELTLDSGNTLLWNEKTDRVLTVDKDGKLSAGAEGETFDENKNKGEYWIVSATLNDTYSTYYIGVTEENTITLDKGLGFDSGDKVVSVVYTGTTKEARVVGVFQSIEAKTSYCPIVRGYVYSLTGTVKADGAQFHSSESDMGNNTATGTAIYGVHYDANNDGKCDFCKNDVCNHQMTTVNSKPADCENDGCIDRKCTECGATEHTVLEAFGHVWQELAEIQPTCEKPGQEKGKVCTRCNKKEEGQLIPPTFHKYENGKCSCGAKEEDENAVELSGLDSIDWKGHNRSKETVTIKLMNDITCTPEEFVAALGSATAPHWIDEALNVGGSIDSTYNKAMTIYALDIDLNGKTLTIQPNGTESFGVEIYGHLRVRNSQNTGELKLIGSSSFYSSLIIPVAINAKVTFDSITVYADVNPVSLEIQAASLEVNNSTLYLEKFYKTDMATYKVITIKCFDDNDNEIPDWTGDYIQWEDENYSIYSQQGTKTEKKGIAKFYIYDFEEKEHQLSNDYIKSNPCKSFGVYDNDNEKFQLKANKKLYLDSTTPFTVTDINGDKVYFGANVESSWSFGASNDDTVIISNDSKIIQQQD